MNRLLTILFFFMLCAGAQAQDAAPQMADAMRQQGKIYVVIAVIAVIFVCLALFMVYLERRINKLERRLDNQNESALK